MKLIVPISWVVVLVASEARVLAADPPPLAGLTAPAASNSVSSPGMPLEADGVAFGMNTEGVARLYDRWWEQRFVPKYQQANPGPKTRELDYQLGQKKKAARRVAQFDARSRSFDKAEFREEFARGNGETMTSVKVARGASAEPASRGVGYTRRFFFFNDKLWKIYDEYKLEARGPFGADFEQAVARVEASLGAEAKRTRAPDSQFASVAFEAPSTRVRVLKLPSHRVAVVRSDTALAREVLDGRARLRARVAEGPLDEEIQAVIR